MTFNEMSNERYCEQPRELHDDSFVINDIMLVVFNEMSFCQENISTIF